MATFTPDGFRLRDAATGHTVTSHFDRAAVAAVAFDARSIARATGSARAEFTANLFGVSVTVQWCRSDADMAGAR